MQYLQCQFHEIVKSAQNYLNFNWDCMVPSQSLIFLSAPAPTPSATRAGRSTASLGPSAPRGDVIHVLVGLLGLVVSVPRGPRLRRNP